LEGIVSAVSGQDEKAKFGIAVIPVPIVKVVREVLLPKQLAPSVVTLLGIVRVVNAFTENAKAPIVKRPLLKVIAAKFEHPLKALAPMVSRSLLITSEVISVLFSKAFAPISVAVSVLGFSSAVKSRVAGKVPV
jgi:hypothetical protein